jgi:hypothetical protein
MTMTSSRRRLFLKRGTLGIAALPVLPLLPLSPLPAAALETGPPAAGANGVAVQLNVRDFGAAGDGNTKDTLAFQQALDRCAVFGGGEVFVPAGLYLIGAIVIGAATTLRLDGQATLQGSPDLADYPLTQVRWEGHWIKGYIGLVSALNVAGIGIRGKGKIVGSTAIKGRIDAATGWRHPALLELTNCRNVRIADCTAQQNDMWAIHPVYCEDIGFENMTIHGGADGIDVDSCKMVRIAGCTFVTADDCISLKSGRGEEGRALMRPTEDVRISDCTFTDRRWACIGIGSETSGGIRNVHIERCHCLGAKTFAVYIKSRPGRGAFIEDIHIDDMDVAGTGDGFLRINMLDSGKQDAAPVPGLDGIPTIRNFHFSRIRVRDVPVLVDASAIHPDKPLTGFSLTDISGTCGKGIALAHMRDVVLRDIAVGGYAGPLLATCDVSGMGLSGAAALPASVRPADVPAPATTWTPALRQESNP